MALNRNENGQTIYALAASLIPSKNAVAQKKLAVLFKKAVGEKWNPSSLGPSLTFLVRAGVVEVSGKRGSREFKLVRAFVEKDNARIQSLMSTRAGQVPRGGNGAMPTFTKTTKMMIAVGESETVVVSMRDAKRLWAELNVIFGEGN